MVVFGWDTIVNSKPDKNINFRWNFNFPPELERKIQITQDHLVIEGFDSIDNIFC